MIVRNNESAIEQAYLVACYRLGCSYHSGQASRGYSLISMARERARRNHSAWNIGRTVEQLGLIGGSLDVIRAGLRVYPKNCRFRNLVAFWLRSMRHSRGNL